MLIGYDLRQENSEVLSERFSPEERTGLSGILEEAEAFLQRGDDSSTPETTSSLTGDAEKGKRQEQQLDCYSSVFVVYDCSILSKPVAAKNHCKWDIAAFLIILT